MYRHGIERIDIMNRLPRPERVIEVHVPADPNEYGRWRWRLHVGYFLIKLATRFMRFKLAIAGGKR